MRKTYVQISGTLYEKGTEPAELKGPMIMPDIEPYRSMIDGSLITSRSKHREHLRAHRCVEVGNDSSLFRKPKPLASPPGLKEAIIRATDQVLSKQRR